MLNDVAKHIEVNLHVHTNEIEEFIVSTENSDLKE